MAPRRTGHSPLAQEVGDENVSIRSRGHARVRVRGPDPCPRLGGLGCRRHVYVNDNTTAVNTIGAFDRHADGTLTPMPGSPFEAGGFGSGKETVAQGALQLSSEGRYLLAVDDGSNQISVLRIKRDGSLKPVVGGQRPTSRACSRRTRIDRRG